MDIRFESTTEEAVFRSPLAGMQPVKGQVERRKDPLTGRVAVLSSFFADKRAALFPPTDRAMIAEMAEHSRAKCFFCPERVDSGAPRYVESLLPGGRVRQGKCLLFPNLFPTSAIHAVITVGEQHHRELNDFDGPLLSDAICCAQQLVRAVIRDDPALGYFTLNGNYLFPAGSSVVHPHLQLLGSREPASAVARMRSACNEFKRMSGGSYFARLLEAEIARGQRLVSAKGPVTWLAPFAPLGANEVMAVLPPQSRLASVERSAIDSLADGLSRVLAYYYDQGYSTYNLSLYSDSSGEADPAFPMVLRIVCRQNVYPNSRSDDYFLQKLLDEEMIVTPPEQLAEELRVRF